MPKNKDIIELKEGFSRNQIRTHPTMQWQDKTDKAERIKQIFFIVARKSK